MYIYIYIHIYIYIYMYISMCMQIQIFIHTYTYTHIHTYIYIHVRIHVCTDLCQYSTDIRTFLRLSSVLSCAVARRSTAPSIREEEKEPRQSSAPNQVAAASEQERAMAGERELFTTVGEEGAYGLRLTNESRLAHYRSIYLYLYLHPYSFLHLDTDRSKDVCVYTHRRNRAFHLSRVGRPTG